MTKDQEEKDDHGSSLIKLILDSDLADLVPDIAEIPLDELINLDWVRDIPVISTLYGMGKMALGIRGYFFIQKLVRFRREFGSVSDEERENFSRKIGEDRKFRQRVGENLMILLDRYDHVDKASLLAKLFRGYLKGLIDYDQFQRLARAVDRTYMEDLKQLLDFYTVAETGRPITNWAPWERLYNSGLSKMIVNVEVDREYKVLSTRAAGPDRLIGYDENDDARLFARVVIGERFKYEFWLGRDST